MIGIPPYVAFALGCLVGVVGYGPVKRWMVSVRQAFRDQMERPDEQRKDSRFLLLIFATMHPAPWVLLLGVPFFIDRLLFDPLRLMWVWMLGGACLGVSLGVLYQMFRNPSAATSP
jgi:hypothetical protein